VGFHRTRELTFILGNKCNISCTYCYPGEYKYGSLKLDLRFAKKGISDFLVEEKLIPLNKIRYFAVGEPTVEFNLMKQIHEYVNERVVIRESKQIRSEIQTNGVFGEEVAKWIGNNIDVICISCDGPPDLQNKQRPFRNGTSTSKIIERNVGILRQYSIDVGMRPTITSFSNNVLLMKEIIDYGKSIGFDYIYFHPMIPQQGPHIRRKDGNPYAVNPIDFAMNYVEAWEYANKKGIFLGNHFTINFDEESEIYCRACLPSPQLTLDGYVSCCDEALYGSSEYDGDRFKDLIIGKYDQETNEIILFWDRIKKLKEKRNVLNMDQCKDCDIALNCGGGCLGEALFAYGSPFVKLSDDFCIAMKHLARNIPRNKGLFRYMHP